MVNSLNVSHHAPHACMQAENEKEVAGTEELEAAKEVISAVGAALGQ